MKLSWGLVAVWYIGTILSVCLCVVLGGGGGGSWWEPCCFTACGGQNHSLDGVHAHICDYGLMKLSRANGRDKQACPVSLLPSHPQSFPPSRQPILEAKNGVCDRWYICLDLKGLDRSRAIVSQNNFWTVSHTHARSLSLCICIFGFDRATFGGKPQQKRTPRLRTPRLQDWTPATVCLVVILRSTV